MLKLQTTEFDGGTVQLTYTDGSEVEEAKELLIVRLPMDDSSAKPLTAHQRSVIQRLHQWADAEFTRLLNEEQGRPA